MVIKNKSGEVRLIWRLALLVLPFLIIAYLLRLIPIRIQIGILINQGIPVAFAESRARTLFMEDPVASSIIGIIQGLTWYLLVFIIINWVEKGSLTLSSFGLAAKGNSLRLISFGVLLGLVMYLGYLGVGTLFEENSLVWSLKKLGILPFLLIFFNLLINGFGEETAFRAYFQTRLVNRHGLWLGIALASITFILLHLIIYPFTGMVIVAGIFLAGFFGILYIWTGSVIMVGIMHTIFNLAPRVLGNWPSDLSLLIVNALAFLLAAVLFSRKNRQTSL